MAFLHGILPLRSTFTPIISLDSPNNPVRPAGINFLIKSFSILHQSFTNPSIPKETSAKFPRQNTLHTNGIQNILKPLLPILTSSSLKSQIGLSSDVHLWMKEFILILPSRPHAKNIHSHSGKNQMQEVQETDAGKCVHNFTTAKAIIRSLVLAGSQVLIFKME